MRLQASVNVAASAAVLDWGSGAVGSSTTTRFLYPGYSERLAEVGETGLIVPRSGTIKNFYVIHNSPQGNGGPIVYTVRVAGADTALVVSLSSTSISGFDTTNSVAVSAGDLVSVKVTKAASIGKSPRNIVATIELA